MCVSESKNVGLNHLAVVFLPIGDQEIEINYQRLLEMGRNQCFK